MSSGSLYISLCAENPLKKREEALWKEFSNSGVMPSVPILGNVNAIRGAHAILKSEYNQLQKVLFGEALAQRGLLSEAEGSVQLEAAGWVLKMINSSKRNYSNKEAMASSFLAFKAASQNKRMVLVCGLEKGATMLRNVAEEKKFDLAHKFFVRLAALAQESEETLKLEAFTCLAISVGWVFAKANKYEELSKIVNLLPEVDDCRSEYFIKNITALRDRVRFFEEGPLRTWIKRARAVISSDTLPGSVQRLLTELLPLIGCGGWYQGPVSLKDGGQFEFRYMVLLYVCQLSKKFKDGVPYGCAQTIVQLFKKDGLQNLSAAFYERHDKVLKPGEKLPARMKPYWPSLAEEVAKVLVSSYKVCYGRKSNRTGEVHSDVNWAIDYLELIYSHFTDDEWSDFRIGKLLIWSGQSERAKEWLLPVIRKKQSEYWAWDLLGGLFPLKRRSCVAKGLLCKAEEIYIKSLKEEAIQLGLNPSDKESLAKEAESGFDLLLSGIVPINGILLEKFTTHKGTQFLVFSDGTGLDAAPLPSKVAHLPSDIVEGTPVILYRDPEDKKQIVAVKLRSSGTLWDVIPEEKAVFIEMFSDKNGRRGSTLAIKGIRFLSFHGVKGCVPGTPMKVRFSDRIQTGKDPKCIWVEKDTSPERHPWDIMNIVQASFVESYSNDKGIVNVFAREGAQYKFYKEICELQPGAPVDIFVLGSPDEDRIYRPRFGSGVRGPRTFLESKPDMKCYAVEPSSSPDRFKWDALYRAGVVYCGESKSGASLTLSSGEFKFNARRDKFDVLRNAMLGDTFEIRYKMRLKGREMIRDVVACQVSEEKLNLTTSFSGIIHMALGSPSVGYVDLYDLEDYIEQEKHPYGSVFVSASLVESCNLIDGEWISGIAVRLPSKYNISRKGRRYENKCYQAISIQC